jgi:acetylornithine deacetylase/succinyl-diaminopimelate desuccinylase-like protein
MVLQAFRGTGLLVEMRNYKDELIDYLCQFIRIPSRSSASGGEEGELQRLIAHNMRRLGARVRLLETSDIPDFQKHPLCHGPDRQYRNRPTVIGELGPEDGPALLILAHSDTVQILNPPLWTIDPFGGEFRDGSIYGLGSSDDKWGLATMLVLMQAMQDLTQPLRKKVIFASTIDEENGVGNGTLLLHLAGLKAEAALYLDGYGMEIDIGCLGGSNLYLRPKEPVSQTDIESDVTLLAGACKAFSQQRVPLFDRRYFTENLMKDCSVQTVQRTDEGGSFIVIPFYTLPGEDEKRFCNSLEEAIGGALGGRMSAYDKHYREPWFEPAVVPVETTLVKHLSGAVFHVLGRDPIITTISKQDSFVLTNHAAIPTVAFGCTHRSSGLGSFHNPDERLQVTELWDGFRIAHFTICNWLKSS